MTFHADDLRDKLSTFFLTFAGAAVAAVGLLIQDSVKVETFGNKFQAAGSFLIAISVIGLLILCIHARLRKVQLEHFALISRIRFYCFGDDLALWNTVQLSPATLPKIKLTKFSGSEMWALTILLPTAVLFSAGVSLIRRSGLGGGHAVSAACFIGAVVLLWTVYVRLARAPVHKQITGVDLDAWTEAAEGMRLRLAVERCECAKLQDPAVHCRAPYSFAALRSMAVICVILLVRKIAKQLLKKTN